MPLVRLRDLGAQGIVTDQDPYALPVGTWSSGVNARFRNNKITNAPVFRTVKSPLAEASPRYSFTAGIGNTNNEMFIGYLSGNVYYYNNGSETLYSPTGYVTSNAETNWTSYTIGNVVYVNRADRAPWYLLPTASTFQTLSPPNLTATAATSTGSAVLTFAANSVPQTIIPGLSVKDVTTGLTIGTVASTTSSTVTMTANATSAVSINDVISFTNGAAPAAWDASWTCKILAQCGGALVALNVTKGASSYPTMVKTSSIVSTNQVPASWDQTNPATLATENILQAMDGQITDACSLGADLIIYGQREAYRMHADGSTFVYSYTKLSYAKGAINSNCTIELDGKNYCFGIDDIWVHDGISEESLCDTKTRDYIYSTLNQSYANRCWVQYNPRLNEIYFGYVSGDPNVHFSGVAGCNRQAVYNMTTETWTFDDLPSIFNTDNGPVSNILTWATVTPTWTTMGGSWQDQEDGGKRIVVCVGDANPTYNVVSSLYAFDLAGQGSVAPYPVDPNATAPMYIERVGIDLDELGADLRDYKCVSTVYPQARVDTAGGNSLQVSVGASDNPNDLIPTWGAYQAYDGVVNYKCDVNSAGRWLAIRVYWPDWRSITLTGFDLDIKTTGRR